MSLSNPTLTNPAVRRFEWKGGAGRLVYYDRETKQNYDQPLPFRFIVLDQVNTIAGFSKRDKSSIWANEVRNIKEDTLYTRTKNGPIEAGLYDELAATSKRGAGFCKSIYIAFELNGNWEIGNIRAYGSALGPWFEFTKVYSVEQGMVAITRGNFVKGEISFYPPSFAWQKWDNAAYQIAVDLDRQLQSYLASYLIAPKIDEEGQGTETINQAPGYTTPEEQKHFDNLKSAGLTNNEVYQDPAPAPGKEDLVIEDIGDEPINLDDIPF